MKASLRLSLTACFVALALLGGLSPASAQERVVVLGFSGPSGGAARAAAKRVLSEEYEIVSLREWQQAAQRLNARGQAPRNLAKVAAELGVKAIVSGGVRRARRQWRLSVVVRDGSNGNVLGRQGRSMRAPTRAGAMAGAMARNLMPHVAEAEGASGGGATSGGRPEPEPEPEYDGGGSSDPGQYSDIENERPPDMGGRGETQQVEDDEGMGGGEEPRRRRRRGRRDRDDEEPEFEEEEPRQPRGPRTSTPHGWLEVGVEVNGASRNFNVPINQYCDTNNREEAAFESSVYPEFGLRLSFYPGGIFTDNWAAHIGVDFTFHHHLYLRVLNRRRDEEVESEQYAVSGGINYRVALGNATRGINIYPRLGMGRYSFFLGDVGNDIVPPFVYDHVYLGVNLHIPLATRYIGLELGGSYLVVFNIGEHAIQAYNASGELPTTNGFHVNAGLTGEIIRGLRWRIGFELLGFISEHFGKGMGWGVDPSTVCGDWEGCPLFPDSCVDDSVSRVPVPGGIYTTGPAKDFAWRLVFHLSYRFGWDPDRLGGGRASSSGGSRWYDDDAEGGGAEEEEEEETDDWDDGDW